MLKNLLTGVKTKEDLFKKPELLELSQKASTDANAKRILKNLLLGLKTKEDLQKDSEAFKTLMQSAENGDVEAMYKIASCYELGKGVSVDYCQAFGWYMRAAISGYDYAIYEVAEHYRAGRGITKDVNKAFKWHVKAAKKNVHFSIYALANMYKEFDDDEYKRELRHLLMNMTDQGNRSALSVLEDLCILDIDAPEFEIFKFFKIKADNGDTEAMVYIGRIYKKHHRENDSFKWYESAAKKGNLSAMHAMGEIYEQHENYKDAFKCFQAASIDMGKLGDYYREGKGVRKNTHKALGCYIQSIRTRERPCPDFNAIVSMYHELSENDKQVAFYLLKKEEDYYSLVSVYSKLNNENKKEAFQIFQSAMENNKSVFNAIVYEYKRLNEADKSVFLNLIKEMADKGNTDAKKAFNELTKKSTSAVSIFGF